LSIDQLKVLLLVSHPGIGSGLETLLRLERRFDVRWLRTTQEIDWSDWRPDIVVAERSTLGESALPGPTVLLVGELPAEAAAGKSDKQFRFLRKDAAVTDLVGVIDEMLGSGPSRSARKPGPARFFVAGAIGAIGVALIAAVVWLVLRS
jgi:hypothetical protein